MNFTSYLTVKNIAIVAAIFAVGGIVYVRSNRTVEPDWFTVNPSAFIQQVSASGNVVAAKDVDLAFTQSGRIASVNARVGSHVGAGTVLARLDSGDLEAVVMQRQAALDAQQAKLQAIKLGTRPEEISLAEADVSNNRIALEQAQRAVLDAVRDAYAKSDDALRNQVYQFVQNPRSQTPTLNFTASDAQLVSTFLTDIASVEFKLQTWQDRIAAYDVQDTAAASAEAQTNLAFVSRVLAEASAVLNKAVSATSLSSYVTAVSAARTSVNGAVTTITSAVTAEKKASAALESSVKTLALKRAGAVQSDIDAQAAQVQAAAAEVANARAQLGKQLIVAPFSGTITSVDAKSGVIASPNVPLISMIGDGTYQIESYVPEVNISLVKVGDEASVTLDAYGSAAVFPAHVISIDPAETVRDGVSTYRSLLQFDARDNRVRVGMTANIMITSDKREGVLSVPRNVVSEKDGTSYVTVKTATGTEERAVKTGAVSSLGRIEILSGLTAGDQVALIAAD